jgi:hypothetical protein
MDKNILARLRLIGYANILPCLLRRVRYFFLSRRYGFASWHARAPFGCRPYKAEVVSLANELQPDVTVEIGCGLGEILSRVRGARRLGFDPDAAVVAAAQHLFGDKCEFAVASISETRKISLAVGQAADLLIMVNWPHGIAWNELRDLVSNLVQMLPIRHIILDTIDPALSGFDHYHSVEDVATLGKLVSTQRSRDGARHLHVVAVT